jgi:hypothetical protein
MGTTTKRARAAKPTYLTREQVGKRREHKSVIVDKELERLHSLHGTVNPQMLVDEARKPTSPLHPLFEWDDAVAGDKYRLIQAYNMIQASKFVVVLNAQRKGQLMPDVVHASPEVRALLPVFRGEGFSFRDQVLARHDSRARFIEEKRGALRSWCNSVIDVQEFDDIRGQIEKWLGAA